MNAMNVRMGVSELNHDVISQLKLIDETTPSVIYKAPDVGSWLPFDYSIYVHRRPRYFTANKLWLYPNPYTVLDKSIKIGYSPFLKI